MQRRIVKEAVIAAPRAAVWRAWTTSDGAREFFAPDARIELRLGGPYEILFVPDAPEGQKGSEGCKVLAFLEGEMFSFDWNAPPHLAFARSGQKTFVVVRLEDAPGGGTRVRIDHAGWPDAPEWNAVFDYFDRAWSAVVSWLTERFEKGPLDWSKRDLR